MKIAIQMPRVETVVIFEHQGESINSFKDCIAVMKSDDYKKGKIISLQDFENATRDINDYLLVNPLKDFRDEWLNYEAMKYEDLPDEVRSFFSWKLNDEN